MSRPSTSFAPATGDLLTAEDLGYTLPDGRALLTGLTLGVGRERTGIVGANGAGKSTLARLLAGDLRPTAGHVARRGRVGYLPQHAAHRARTAERPPSVAEMLGVAEPLAALERIEGDSADPVDFDVVGTRWELHAEIAAALGRVGLGGLTAWRTADTLSGGEATRLAFAALVLRGADVLVLDEPTNDLDRPSRDALYAFVERWPGGLVVATHDRALLTRVDRVLELTALGSRLYGGGWSLYVAQRDAEAAAAERELADARRTLRTTERTAQAARERQARRAARGKADARKGGIPRIMLGIRRETSQHTTARLNAVGERTVADARARADAARTRVEVRERLAIAPPAAGLRAGQRVVAVEAVRYTPPGAATPALRDTTLAIAGPERVALVGPNGSGKTTLLRLLAGDLAPDAGTITLGVAPDAVAYVDQHALRLRGDWTVLENVRASNAALDEQACRHVLAQYRFRGDAALVPASALSGGERVRAALACALHGAARLLLLDEPTNHLDLDALRAVEEMLASFDGALVVASHDETFLAAIGVERYVSLG